MGVAENDGIDAGWFEGKYLVVFFFVIKTALNQAAIKQYAVFANGE